MAFNSKHLTALTHGNGFTMWVYRTADASAAVDNAGYFSGEAVNMLGIGDVILVQTVNDADDPTSVTAVGFHFVNANDGTTVDVANVLAITATDSD